MLKYLVITTGNLITSAVMLGMLFAYIRAEYGPRGRNILTAGALLGFFGAIVMAWLKNKTKLINTATWNSRIFYVSIAAFVLLLILDIGWLRKHKAGKAGIIVPVIAAVLGFNIVFYALPDVLAYPYTFVLGGDAVLSTGFLFRIIGVLLGVALAVLTGLAVHAVCRRIGTGTVAALQKIALGINALQQLSKILSTLVARRVLSGRALFQFVRFTSNNANLFVYGILAAALIIPVVLWMRSFHVNEPYENPAQHRKIRAKWRSVRRWSSTVILTFACAVFIMTAVSAYVNRPVELSPIEESQLAGDNVYVPLTQVEDGHLHRFAYTMPNGKTVRFIVIKKPNSSSFGIGLDACDVCGETGYFERNGQIVCKLCDVVMNINTIGFKGGCNPIVIDYSVENGYIIVPTETLIEHEDEFKS